VRVRLDITGVDLRLGAESSVTVHYSLALLSGDQERLIPAQPEHHVVLSTPTTGLFESALDALRRDLSEALGLNYVDNTSLGSEEDLLDDPELIDDAEEAL